MPTWISQALEVVGPYWSFVAQLFVFWFVGQNMKKRVWTKGRAVHHGFFGFMRKSMWAHPMVAGLGWGLLFPIMPAIELVTSRGGAVTQGILAGVVSVMGFRALEAVAENRGWDWVLKVLRETGRPTEEG
jgi:hypothetical protein